MENDTRLSHFLILYLVDRHKIFCFEVVHMQIERENWLADNGEDIYYVESNCKFVRSITCGLFLINIG